MKRLRFRGDDLQNLEDRVPLVNGTTPNRLVKVRQGEEATLAAFD